MAWIVQTSLAAIDSPQYEMEAEDLQLLDQMASDIAAEMSRLDMEHPNHVFNAQWVAPQYGFRYPKLDRPLRINIKKMVGPLPDFMGYIVTEKVREYIESVEPGVHHFMPVEVTMPDGSMGEPRFFLNVCVRIGSVILEKSPGVTLIDHPRIPDLKVHWADFGVRDQITLDRETIRGHAIWYEYQIGRNFMSDDFHAFIKENSLRGFEIKPFGFQRAEEA